MNRSFTVNPGAAPSGSADAQLHCGIFVQKAIVLTRQLAEKVAEALSAKDVKLGDLRERDLVLRNGSMKAIGMVDVESLDLVTCEPRGPGRVSLEFTLALRDMESVYTYVVDRNSTAIVTFSVPYVRGRLVMDSRGDTNETAGHFRVTESLDTTKTFLEQQDEDEDAEELTEVAVKASERGLSLFLTTGIQPVVGRTLRDFLDTCAPSCFIGTIVLFQL